MFTGIIEATGSILSITPQAANGTGDVSLVVQSNTLDFSDVGLGDSIATSGICLTVIEFGSNWYKADVSKETLQKTILGDWQTGTVVNLEKAMLASTRFGGHIVSGHVDGIGTVTTKRDDARSIYYEVTAPTELARYLAVKGSVTVDGISLTTNNIKDNVICLNIVPHTAQVTNIASQWQLGAKVNLEVDVIARYLERLMLYGVTPQATSKHSPKSNIDKTFLAEHGFLK